MKYKHIIFDIDGTMLDSEYANLTALQKVIEKIQGRTVKIPELNFASGIPAEVALKQLGIEDTQKANYLWNIYTKELAHTMQLFKGIKELVINLKNKGIRLGIITSKNKTEYLSDFSHFGLDSYFDTIICVEDSIAPKPSPEPMFAYLRKALANPHEVLYIGDTLYDSNCAIDAGVDFGLALWGYKSASRITATYHFKMPQEVINLIDK